MNTLAQPPKEITSRPLVEALFETRFQSNADDMAVNILAAALFQDKLLKDEFPVRERLASSFMPDEVRNKDPNLAYVNDIAFRTENGNGSIMLGRKSLAVAYDIEYPGWVKFKELIERVLTLVNDSNIIGKVERFSLKYTNAVPYNSDGLSEAPNIFNINFEIAGEDQLKGIFDFRTEHNKEDGLALIQVLSRAQVGIRNSYRFDGTLFVIDCIQNSPTVDFLQNPGDQLDSLHSFEKATFKEITSEGIFKLYPELRDEFV